MPETLRTAQSLLPPWEISAAELAALQRRLAAHGLAVLRAYGSSMRPSLKPGARLVVQRASPDGIARGTVVAFARRGRVYVHRVVGTHATGGSPLLLTRGDALPHGDLPVSPDELLGTALYVMRGRQIIPLDAHRPLHACVLALLLRLRAEARHLAARLGWPASAKLSLDGK